MREIRSFIRRPGKTTQIGIPVFVLEDGTVTMDCDAAFEAARRAKKPAVVMVGSHLCKACRNRLAELKEEGLPVEFHDIVENLNDMRLYLQDPGKPPGALR